MKKVLVAENANGAWRRVGSYTVSRDGRMSLPMKYNGQMAGYFIRSGAAFLLGDAAAETIDYSTPSGSLQMRIGPLY